MTITREQVADLREGDVVELREDRFPDVVTRGPITKPGGTYLGSLLLCWSDGRPATWTESSTLTVVSRAPHPLYVNHPRTEPVPGDVARDEEADGVHLLLRTAGERFPDKWIDQDGVERIYPVHRRLRLLVDGETGRCVPAEQPADPLGHVRKGDPTPESADDEPPCSAGANNFACTRERGHVGQHIAGTGVRNPVAAVWS